MDHEKFPVAGFEFMDEPATDTQKDIIADLAAKAGEPIDRNGQWPEPFSKFDAANMIHQLEQRLGRPSFHSAIIMPSKDD